MPSTADGYTGGGGHRASVPHRPSTARPSVWKLGSHSAPQKPTATATATTAAAAGGDGDGDGKGDDSRPPSSRAPLERLRDRHPQLPATFLGAALEALGDADRVTQQLQARRRLRLRRRPAFCHHCRCRRCHRHPLATPAYSREAA